MNSEEKSRCEFQLAWIGACKADSEGMFCDEHKDIKCSSCGEKATKECSETMGLVCGFPLCDDCEHTIRENGTNSGELPEGLRNHCKKTEQIHESWCMRR